MIPININPAALRRLYIIIGILNTLLIGAFGLIVIGRLTEGLAPVRHFDPAYQLNLQMEGPVIAVWYSSALAMIVAIMAILNYWSDKSTRSAGQVKWWGFRFGWLLLAGGTLYISIDESAQIHEGLALWAVQDQGVALEGLTNIDALFGWLLLLAPVFLVGALLLLGFFFYWLRPTPRARLIAILGMCCWAFVPVLEYVESRLMDTFGTEGAFIERFFEESLEITGVTLLLMAAIEYLIARNTPIQDAQTKTLPHSGRRAIFAGLAAPLLLIPLAGLGAVMDNDLREGFSHISYRLGAARIARAVHTLEPDGNWLIMSNGCDPALIGRYLPIEMLPQGSLLAYPDGVQPRITPSYSLAVLDIEDVGKGEASEHLSASLARIAMMSGQLWYLRCGDASETDLLVEEWLSQHSSDIEQLSLPGMPSLVLTRATPTVPLPPVDVRHKPASATIFGEDQVELVGYEWFLDRHGNDATIRVIVLWRALTSVETDYHVFMHLTDHEGKLLAQKDGVPMYNRYPFSQWEPGQVVVDSYDIPLSPDLPLTETEIRIGLYDFETGQRLPTGDSDHFKLEQPGQPSAL